MALETMVDRDLCVQAADRALAYLRERVLDDTWVAAHRDIAYYFKAPQAFLLAGLRDEAAAAFDALEPFLDEGGAASDSEAPLLPPLVPGHKRVALRAQGGGRGRDGADRT